MNYSDDTIEEPPTREPDKYDRAIAYLTEHPEEMDTAFTLPNYHKAGCLFNWVHSDPKSNHQCGCLTLVRAGCSAETPELTAAIRSDDRIPINYKSVTLAHLPVFAEWQRRIDKELNRPV